jgi:CBS domain-containing protein
VTTVAQCLAQKSGPVIAVTPQDYVVSALSLMRDNKVRAILVVQADRLVGIITQGDCAIKVLLPGKDAKTTLVGDVMTSNPMSVRAADPLEACMGLMAARNFRHLPVVENSKVIGVISIGDVVKDNIRNMGDQINFLETYIKGHGNSYS